MTEIPAIMEPSRLGPDAAPIRPDSGQRGAISDSRDDMDGVLLDIVDEAAGLVTVLQAHRGAGPAGPAPRSGC